ncbi:MAG: hypothetical protein ACYTEV_11170 [Planctomycetota bacterium]
MAHPRTRVRRLTASLMLAAAAAAAASASTAIATITAADGPPRPRDPFVQRCVLDGNARMIVVALAEPLSVAYDAKTGGLALAWNGPVRYQGAVYDTTHGPQPVHEGPILMRAAEGPTWMLARDGDEPVAARVRWLGYRLDGTIVHLNFELSAPGIDPVTVRETPEVALADDGSPRLVRRFAVAGPEGVTAVLVAPRDGTDAERAAAVDADDPAAIHHATDADGRHLIHLPGNASTELRFGPAAD